MSNDRAAFFSYEELNPTRPVRLGNGGIIQAVGMGGIRAKSHSPGGRVPTESLHVPDIRRSLFSIAAATQVGHVGLFSQLSLWLMDKAGDPLLVAERDGSLYRTKLQELTSEANVVNAAVRTLARAIWSHQQTAAHKDGEDRGC